MTIYVKAACDFTAKFALEREDGYLWSTATNNWHGAPAVSDSQISMTQGNTAKEGLYYGSLSHSNLTATAAGVFFVHIWNMDEDRIVSTQRIYIKEGVEVATLPVYHAELNFAAKSTTDKYSVTFYWDNQRITSGITSPTIQVVKRSDGSDLVASTSLTAVASGMYKYDESTNRLGGSEEALVILGMTHEGVARTFAHLISRDR